LGVGFGIRNAQQVATVLQHSELAIVGTALVEHLHEVAGAATARGADPASAVHAAAARCMRELTHLYVESNAKHGAKP
jgi:tryptophan synthase alpha subunit